jgi:hypothetical protein
LFVSLLELVFYGGYSLLEFLDFCDLLFNDYREGDSAYTLSAACVEGGLSA